MSDMEYNKGQLTHSSKPETNTNQERPNRRRQKAKPKIVSHEITSSGDGKETSTMYENKRTLPLHEAMPTKESPEKKRRRTALSQRNGCNDRKNLVPIEVNRISNILAVQEKTLKNITSKRRECNDSVSQGKKCDKEPQHTKIAQRSVQDETANLVDETKHIVKVPENTKNIEIKLLQVGKECYKDNHQCEKGISVQGENPTNSKIYEYEGKREGLQPKNRKRHSNGMYRLARHRVQNSGEYVHDPKKLSPFDLLSDEIIIKIFEYVPRNTLVHGCALTCKRLKNICYDDTLWQRVDLGGKKLAPGQGGKIILRGTKILRMSKTTVSPPLFSHDLDLCFLRFHSTINELRLKYLDLSFASIKESCLESLFRRCRNLRKVALENCNLNRNILFQLSQNKSLEVLHMGMALGITAIGLSHLAQGLNNTLVDLNISWTGMDAETVEEALLLLGNNSRTLTRLNFAGCKASLTDDRLNFILGILKVKQQQINLVI